jgi:hypothetical protein
LSSPTKSEQNLIFPVHFKTGIHLQSTLTLPTNQTYRYCAQIEYLEGHIAVKFDSIVHSAEEVLAHFASRKELLESKNPGKAAKKVRDDCLGFVWTEDHRESYLWMQAVCMVVEDGVKVEDGVLAWSVETEAMVGMRDFLRIGK